MKPDIATLKSAIDQVTQHPDLVESLLQSRLRRLSVERLAELWDVEPSTVRTWCRDGLLRADCLGGRYRIAVSAAEDFLRSRSCTLGASKRLV